MRPISWYRSVRGPWEPEWCTLQRHEYWQRRAWLAELMERIATTESGRRWLVRVGAYGQRVRARGGWR